jgi:hypothetical protein
VDDVGLGVALVEMDPADQHDDEAASDLEGSDRAAVP